MMTHHNDIVATSPARRDRLLVSPSVSSTLRLVLRFAALPGDDSAVEIRRRPLAGRQALNPRPYTSAVSAVDSAHRPETNNIGDSARLTLVNKARGFLVGM